MDGDIGTKETAIRVVDAAVKHFGRIDLLVNSAGIYLAKPFTQYTPEDFDLMIHTNVAGYFFVTQQAVAQMQKQKSGHIVSIATVLVDQPLAGAPIALPVLTKSTIPAFSRALAMEFVADGIRANTISPGVVDTPMHAKDDHRQLEKLSPAGRLVQVSEIVDALLYLESATWLTAKIFESMEEHMPAPSGNNSPTPSSRLKELGIILPAPPNPLGAYVESSDAGNLLFLSGTLPVVNRKARDQRAARRKPFRKRWPRSCAHRCAECARRSLKNTWGYRSPEKAH